MRFLLIYLSFASLFLASCRDASELYPPTSIEIMDPVRHYYPVVQGEKFEININIKNTGKHFLKITDVQTSCGCMAVDKNSIGLIRAGEIGTIKIVNDSKKNIGYVKHFIKIYGNIPDGEAEVIFDYNVVPDALYTPDYEEIYSKENKSNEIRRQKYYTDQ
ncbi:DUF1573 domain-containing protein [Capnocytophaga gingivalis]|uniref:DUF1573 domain-containing protein n=1 Tax=Capnocytophaga gingivalis TaxID=1017 RepID=UPI0028D4056F|nr:DUF1573 domain-containing protein [Capnocytophaga gingivalis]